VVKMTPAGLIFGQVVDENGEPIESAQVRLLQQRLVMGKRRWVGSIGAATNDQGRYRLPNLRPGRYIVAVLNENRTLEAGKTGYASVFYPKAPDPASAAPIQISGGQQSEADFELSPVPVYKISGVVTGPKMQGIGINMADGSGNETALFARMDPATGEFEIRGVPKGTYTLHAQGNTEQGDQLKARATVTVNNDLSGVVLVLHPPIEIPIEVRSESAQPGGTDPRSFIPGLNIQAMSTTDEQAGGYANFEGSPENGRYVLHLPESGTYNLGISSYGPGYVRTATSGGTDLLTEPLVVPSTGNVSPIEVVLGSDGATITGVVRGAEGPGVIVAVPDDENRQPTLSGFGFGSVRQFRLPALAPGDYTIYATRPSQDADYSDRDTLKPFRSKAVHVTLAPNQTTEVTLDMIETEQ
jgi:carboxypeptidase family protein